MISYRDVNANVIEYEYNEIGNKTAIIYPDHTRVEYLYDKMDRLVEVRKGEDTTKYTYDKIGNKVETLLPNGTIISYTYNENRQVVSQVSTSVTNTLLSSYQYEYDENGNIQRVEEIIEGNKTVKEYTYDKEERLLTSISTKDDQVEENKYTYDRIGNKVALEKRSNHQEEYIQYSFDTNNELIEQEGNQKIEYSYDENGHVIERKYDNGLVETLIYDTKGQILEIESNNGKTINYSYDGLSNRVEKRETTEIDKSVGSRYLEYIEDDKVNEDYNQELVKQTTDEKLENLKQELQDHTEDVFRPICRSDNRDRGKESSTTIEYITDINREYTKVLQTRNEEGNVLDSYIYGSQRISQVDAGYSPEQRYNLQKYGRIDGIDVGSYDDVLAYSQHNMNSNKVMLGKYDGGSATSYITKAGKEYSYFDVGGD